jgi:hypothetical protein
LRLGSLLFALDRLRIALETADDHVSAVIASVFALEAAALHRELTAASGEIRRIMDTLETSHTLSAASQLRAQFDAAQQTFREVALRRRLDVALFERADAELFQRAATPTRHGQQLRSLVFTRAAIANLSMMIASAVESVIETTYLITRDQR